MSLFAVGGKLRAWLRLGIFYAALHAAFVASVLPFMIWQVTARGEAFAEEVMAGQFNPWGAALLGVAMFVPSFLVTAGARRFLDRKPPLASLGLSFRYAPRGLGLGFVGGVVFVGITCGVLAVAGGNRFTFLPVTGAGVVSWAGLAVAFLPFAAIEELYLRGYPIKVLDESWHRAAAVMSTSVVFSLFHLAGPGATVLSFINITLAGVILGLIYLQSGSLWPAIGFHWGWNFALGSIFGYAVSGLPVRNSLLAPARTSPAWLYGGAFGPEGSVILTFTAAALAAALILTKGAGLKIAAPRDAGVAPRNGL